MLLSKILCRRLVPRNVRSYNFSNQIKNEMFYIDCEGEGSSSVLKIKKSELPVNCTINYLNYYRN